MFVDWMDKVLLEGRKEMDRYKEGYNQANRDWEKKIQKEIDRLRKYWGEYTILGKPLILKVQIDLLENLLKKG